MQTGDRRAGRVRYRPVQGGDPFDGAFVPAPRVLEGQGLLAVLAVAEQDIVVRFGIERRIEIDEIDASGRPCAHHVKAIAVIERVVLELHMPSPPHGAGSPRTAPC